VVPSGSAGLSSAPITPASSESAATEGRFVVLFGSCGSFLVGLRFLVRSIHRIRQKPPLPSSKGLNDKSGFIANEAPVKIPPSVSLFHFDFFEPLPLQIEVSDAGLLPR